MEYFFGNFFPAKNKANNSAAAAALRTSPSCTLTPLALILTDSVAASAGLMGWTRSQEDADYVATGPELDPEEGE